MTSDALSKNELRAVIDAAGAPDGAQLSVLERALVQVGLTAAVTALDQDGMHRALRDAFMAGASPEQVQEVVSLVSGLGVHSLMITATAIIEHAAAAGFDLDQPLSAEQEALWKKRVGDDPFWVSMERELPGFLRALIRLSPAQFEAFFDFCAVPWKSGTVRARLKELIAMASDATAAHCFMPGFRLHLANAIHLGASKPAILECLDLADAVSEPKGVRDILRSGSLSAPSQRSTVDDVGGAGDE